MYFVEIRAAVARVGKPVLVPLAEVHKHTGFRSAFAYPENVADFIREQGSTNNLRGMPVYADTLFMDFDSHRPDDFLAWLATSGLAYSVWDSGGRSVHVHIEMEPALGPWVPDAMRAWTKQHAPTADVSFLHPAGMYRLAGTYHHRNPGRCKTMTDKRDGTKLKLSPVAGIKPFVATEATGTREHFFMLLTERKTEGHRAPFIWRIATAGAEAGLPYEEVLEHVRWWNEHFCFPPRDDRTIMNQVQSAYRRHEKRHA
jgi:hypothetical protein